MWIKTQTGALCNLALVAEVRIGGPIAPTNTVYAYGTDGTSAALGKFDTREEAQAYIDGLFAMLAPVEPDVLLSL